MAKIPVLLVFFHFAIVVVLLVVEAQSRPQLRLWTLVFRSMSMQVAPNGSVNLTPAVPSLYHLVKEKIYPDKMTGNYSISIEAIATGRLVCMNKRGGLYTLEEEEWRKEKSATPNRTMERRKQPPEECLFKSIDFNTTESYEKGSALYSVAHSNATVGRFLGFNESGYPRSFRRALNNVTANRAMKATFVVPRFLDKMLNDTFFLGDTQYNVRVRKCIKRESETFSLQRLRHSPLKKTIKKCIRRIARKYGRGFKPTRLVMKQNSLQRDKPTLRPRPRNHTNPAIKSMSIKSRRQKRI